jgi:thymidylate synthase
MTVVEIIKENDSFPNAWARAVRIVMDMGQEITFGGKIKDKDQYEKKIAKDTDCEIVLEGNALKEAIAGVLHPKFPTKEMHKCAYMKEWERGYNWEKQGFTYCYEDRAENYIGAKKYTSINNGKVKEWYEETSIDQWELAREDLMQQISTGIQSNRNVIVIGNPPIDRFEIPNSPPCLREIWIRHEGNHKASVKTVWRSRDLFAAWMTNIPGLLSAVMREVIVPNNCEIVQYVDKSHSLHLYREWWDAAALIKPVPVNPQTMGRR